MKGFPHCLWNKCLHLDPDGISHLFPILMMKEVFTLGSRRYQSFGNFGFLRFFFANSYRIFGCPWASRKYISDMLLKLSYHITIPCQWASLESLKYIWKPARMCILCLQYLVNKFWKQDVNIPDSILLSLFIMFISRRLSISINYECNCMCSCPLADCTIYINWSK